MCIRDRYEAPEHAWAPPRPGISGGALPPAPDQFIVPGCRRRRPTADGEQSLSSSTDRNAHSVVDRSLNLLSDKLLLSPPLLLLLLTAHWSSLLADWTRSRCITSMSRSARWTLSGGRRSSAASDVCSTDDPASVAAVCNRMKLMTWSKLVEN